MCDLLLILLQSFQQIIYFNLEIPVFDFQEIAPFFYPKNACF